MYIDQREPGIEYNKTNNSHYIKAGESYYIPKKDLLNKIPITKIPTHKNQVLLCNHLTNFNHQMDALKHAKDNNLEFIVWNDVMYDLYGNNLQIDYWILK